MTRPKKEESILKKSYIKVYMTKDEKREIINIAKSYELSSSTYLKRLGLNQKLGLLNDPALRKEIIKAQGMLGKYVGMLKIHLNKYELKDFTQKEIRLELKKAQEAREKILELVTKAINS